MERLFSVMNLLKDDTQNRLSVHLEAVVRIFIQHRYTTATFPYKRAFKLWLDGVAKGRYQEVVRGDVLPR